MYVEKIRPLPVEFNLVTWRVTGISKDCPSNAEVVSLGGSVAKLVVWYVPGGDGIVGGCRGTGHCHATSAIHSHRRRARPVIAADPGRVDQFGASRIQFDDILMAARNTDESISTATIGANGRLKGPRRHR